MIKKLTIDQFVIIDRLDLDFHKGLTILTGETGAGKSILLDAMGLVLGEESNPDSIRQGAQQSMIEALFAPPPSHPVWTSLKKENLVSEADTDFKIHRTIKRAGLDDIDLSGVRIDQEL